MSDTTSSDRPLNLVTEEGVNAWKSRNEVFEVSYGLIGHDEEGCRLYRALFDKAGEMYLLVDPDQLEVVSAPISFRGADATINHVFEVAPGTSPRVHLDTSGFVDGKLPIAACFMAPAKG